MSGVAGGNRIKKQNVQATFTTFIDQVLNKIPGFVKASLSGSIKVGIKPDYGDIDCIALFEGDDKKEVKQRIIDTITKLPQNTILPFRSEKYKGRRYYNSGEIVSVLFPIIGEESQTIQVDIIVSLSETEHTFKNNFLDISAEKQGLLLGLAKAILIEESPESVFRRLKISNVSPLGGNEEYEFNLSSVKLTLRKVKLQDFKEIAREDIWSSPDWNDVKKLFVNYNINGSFQDLLNDLAKKLKNQRSKNRVAGTFRSMVSVKSGEVGTPKGDAKEAALKEVSITLSESIEENYKQIALYAGGFKPPHKAHFENAKFLSSVSDKLIIFIGPVKREGAVLVTQEQSKTIWEIYAKYLQIPVEVRLSKITPIRDLYEWVDANQDRVEKIITGTIESEMAQKFGYFIKNKEKYSKVELKILPVIESTEDQKFSATTLRQTEQAIAEGSWIPKEVAQNLDDKQRIIDLLLSKIESFINFFKTQTEVIHEKCWKGYTQKGMKKKSKKIVPNCVKQK
jgi:nicotinamide mononucleotide adenylyltransferase